jgi:hypothetical protein
MMPDPDRADRQVMDGPSQEQGWWASLVRYKKRVAEMHGVGPEPARWGCARWGHDNDTIIQLHPVDVCF